MDDRLSGLLLRLRERFAPDVRPDEVEAFLSAEGYERAQIGEILSLLFGRRDPADERRPAAGTTGFRVLASHERARLTPEAWGYLLSLSNTGLLSGPELEQVIDRAMSQLDGRIGLDELRSLLEMSGYGDASGGSDPMTVH